MKRLTLIGLSIFIFTNMIIGQDIINETGKDGKFVVRDAEQKEALIIEDGNVGITGELSVEKMPEGNSSNPYVVWDRESKSLKVVQGVFSHRSPISKPLDNGAQNYSIMDPIIPTDSDEPLQVIIDDLEVIGSECVGIDCVAGQGYGYDTIILKENNLRIKFEDTSVAAGFPTNDWRLVANSSSSGGASFFAIEDVDAGRYPFRVEAGAPAHSVYIEDYGRVGFGTSTPAVELHVKDSDTPTLRLEQDGSGGWSPQTWDIAGNETNFFIRDATNGSKLPFRIFPNSPSSSLIIKSTGVGVGTTSPEEHLHVDGNDEQRIKVSSTNGLAGVSVDGNMASNSWSMHNSADSGDLRFHVTSGAFGHGTRMILKEDGKIGVGTASPAEHLHVYGSGSQRLKLSSTDDLAGITIDGNMASNSWSIHNSTGSGDLRFQVISGTYGNNTRMILKENGDVGIGTALPQEKLEIEFDSNTEILFGQGDSDLDVTFISLRSPNGTKYYITVDNSGNLVTSTTKP